MTILFFYFPALEIAKDNVPTVIDGRGGKVESYETKEMKRLNKACEKAEKIGDWDKLKKLYEERNKHIESETF
jgi:hypothetical protein